MRYRSKSELLQDVAKEHEALLALLQQLPVSRYGEAGVWGDGWTVGDLVAHLAEWHEMLLRWFRKGQEGGVPQLPAPGYKWNETPRLNRDIWAKHQGRPFDTVQAAFDTSYERIIRLMEDLSESELLEPGHFKWTGKNALVTYVGANTASHYRFARKVLNRWMKSSRNPG